MTKAALSDRVRLERRPETDDDGAGNTEGEFAPVIGGEKLRAEIRELTFGAGETVDAGKLTGHAPVLVVLRASSITRAITAGDRLIDLTNDRTLNIRSVQAARRNDYVTLACESGVAT